MTIIIAGTVRIPPENLAAFRPHQDAMLAASRAEDGCITYSYAVDVQDPGLIRVFEAWRDQRTAVCGRIGIIPGLFSSVSHCDAEWFRRAMQSLR